MSVEAYCSHCGKRYVLPEKYLGKKLKCKQCDCVFRPSAGGPVPSALTDEPPVTENSETTFAEIGDLPPVAPTPIAGFAPTKLDRSSGVSSARPTKNQHQRSGRPTRRPKKPPELKFTKFEKTIKDWGTSLLIVGVLSLILPHFGFEIRRLRRAGEYAPYAGTILGIIGSLLIMSAYNRVDNKKGAMLGGGGLALILVMFGASFLFGSLPSFNSGFARRSHSNHTVSRPNKPTPRKESARPPNNAKPIPVDVESHVDHDRQSVSSPPGGSPFERPFEKGSQSKGFTNGATQQQIVEKLIKNLHRAMDQHFGHQVRSKFPEEFLMPLVGGRGGKEIYLTHPDQVPMLGIFSDVAEFGTRPIIKSIIPLYGDEFENDPSVTIAKSGYAISGFNVNAHRQVEGIQVIFMRHANGRFQPDDTYLSQWIGVPPENNTASRLGGTGQSVYGIHLRKGLVVDAIGLIVEPNDQ